MNENELRIEIDTSKRMLENFKKGLESERENLHDLEVQLANLLKIKEKPATENEPEVCESCQ